MMKQGLLPVCVIFHIGSIILLERESMLLFIAESLGLKHSRYSRSPMNIS